MIWHADSVGNTNALHCYWPVASRSSTLSSLICSAALTGSSDLGSTPAVSCGGRVSCTSASVTDDMAASLCGCPKPCWLLALLSMLSLTCPDPRPAALLAIDEALERGTRRRTANSWSGIRGAAGSSVGQLAIGSMLPSAPRFMEYAADLWTTSCNRRQRLGQQRKLRKTSDAEC